MRLADHDDMVETLTPDRSDQPLGKAVLPRRPTSNRPVTDAYRG